MQDTRSRANVTTDSLDVAGRRRTYTLAAPPDSEPDSLLLVFHGSKQTGEKFRAFTGNSFDALAGAGSTLVAYLDGYRGHWNDARKASAFAARTEDVDDVGFAQALIGRLTDEHRIDRSRVYAAGYSNGGQMVIRLVHEVPGALAGAAILSATQPAPESFLLDGAATAPMPVLLVHGTGDRIASYSGGTMKPWARMVFRVGGVALSAERTAAYFAARNGITQPHSSAALPQATEPNGTSVTRTDYRQDGRSPVTLYTVDGGGHTIPGPAKAPFIMGRTNHDMNTADAIDEFFGLARNG
jgi:polyhydroxybutyrate depolymerase